MRRKAERVKGHILPSPKLTKAGYWAIFTRLIAPFLSTLLLLDLALFFLFHHLLAQCYGILCLFEPF